MELKKIKDDVYYIPNVTNIGVVVDESAAVLIDSGLDDDAGKKILKCLDKEGIRPVAIINTHSHADHIGGNALIKSRTGALIHSPEMEDGIVQAPYYEPFYLFSGAHPLKDLMNKYLMAPRSRVDNVISASGGTLQVGAIQLETVPLPGHSPNQTGVAVKGVLFCGDAVFSEELLNKHKLPFCMNIEKQVETLNYLKQSVYETFVPSHGAPVNDITGTADAYLQRISEIKRCSLKILEAPNTTAGFLKDLCGCLDIEMHDVKQYYLNNTVAMAYLSWLYNSGEITLEIKENILYWKRKGE